MSSRCRASARIVQLPFCVMLLLLGFAAEAFAHEIRPAFLQIVQTSSNRFTVTWRTPTLSGMRLPVVLKFGETVRNLTGPAERQLPDSIIETRMIETAEAGLAGQRLDFVGLQATITDVLVRVRLLDGSGVTTMVYPSQPWIEFAPVKGSASMIGVYFVSGFEHILFGVDHLLFVFGLIFIIRSGWMLFKTITAFTVAHSITLAIATLGGVQIPGPPLNALIALSILFLGIEAARAVRGDTSFTLRHPWVMAFGFGLLHGFGFASGLMDLGVPQSDIPLALLTFNLGVEAGQLAFVGVVLAAMAASRSLGVRSGTRMQLMPAYVIGISGASSAIDRVVTMFSGAG